MYHTDRQTDRQTDRLTAEIFMAYGRIGAAAAPAIMNVCTMYVRVLAITSTGTTTYNCSSISLLALFH